MEPEDHATPRSDEDATSQLPALKVLMNLGWKYLTPEEALALRGGRTSEVLLHGVLEDWLRANNRIEYRGESVPFTEANIASAISNLCDEQDDGLVRTNEKIYDQLLLGKSLKQLVVGDSKSFQLKYIDWDNPANNAYHVTEEYPVDRSGSQATYRPDIVLFVNGIPLVVIEAKSPLKRTATGDEAHEQIRQYERDIPRLFYPNAFNILTDGMHTEYGATGAPAQFYGPWPDAWPRSVPDFPDALAKDLWCLCEPSRLLDLLAHFIVFEVDPERGNKIKKICRYQQFRAVNKAVERVAAGEHRKGLIWHTQGSGKSLTMVFLALKLKTHLTLDAPTLANPNILVLTDRIDLDHQISKTFDACGLPNPVQCGSVAVLREAVNRGGNGQILLSTIFKFAG